MEEKALLSQENQILQEMDEAISTIEFQTRHLDNILKVVEGDIRHLHVRIKECNSIEDANAIFGLLSAYQEALSKLSFKYKYPVSDELMEFIRNFDRIDDPDTRKYLFTRIQNKVV